MRHLHPRFLRRPAHRHESGFTLIELIVILAIISIAALIMVPKLFWFVDRARLRSAAAATKAMIQSARLAALKGQGNARVVFNYAKGEIFAYIDTDGDRIFNRNVDRMINDYFINDRGKKANVRFMDTADGSPDAAGAAVNWDDAAGCEANACIAFDGTGTSQVGSIHFTDGYWNFLEVRIQNAATGRTDIRKWHRVKLDYVADVLHTEPGSRSQGWVWYEDRDTRVPFPT